MNVNNISLNTNMSEIMPNGTYPGDHWNYPWWEPVVERYYPVYYTNWHSTPNKTEQAFKIVQKLVESKRIKLSTVKDFIETVNEISEVL